MRLTPRAKKEGVEGIGADADGRPVLLVRLAAPPVDGAATPAGQPSQAAQTGPLATDADVIVVNTCSFIDPAKKESIDTILEMAQHKAAGTCRRLVVTGCLAERYRDELRAEIPEIDAVLGTGEVPAIVEALTGASTVNAAPSSV